MAVTTGATFHCNVVLTIIRVSLPGATVRVKVKLNAVGVVEERFEWCP